MKPLIAWHLYYKFYENMYNRFCESHTISSDNISVKRKDGCFFVSVAVSLYLGELQTKSISTKALVQ